MYELLSFDELYESVELDELYELLELFLDISMSSLNIINFRCGLRIMWDLSSAGRASALQAEGHRFEPCRSHFLSILCKDMLMCFNS